VHIEQAQAKNVRKLQGCGPRGDPHLFIEAEELAGLPFPGERGADAHEHAHVRAAPAHVFLQLPDPLCAPVLGALGLPEENPGGLATASHYSLDDIAAAGALAYFLNHIQGEGLFEVLLQCQFQHLALQLLRALVAFSLSLD